MRWLIFLVLPFVLLACANNPSTEKQNTTKGKTPVDDLRIAPAWLDFVEKRRAGDMKSSILNDYSYAGYALSEKPIPDTSKWQKLNVVDFGAVANDEGFDDHAIVKAIAKAESSELPTVVFFPKGRYKVGSPETANDAIVVSGSHIVLQGEGSGEDGTEIFIQEHGNFPWRFQFRADKNTPEFITDILAPIDRGAFTVTVASGAGLKVGQIVELLHEGNETLPLNLPGLSIPDEWHAFKTSGLRTREKHIVARIDGSQVTFKNPVQAFLAPNNCKLVTFPHIKEVGLENIRLSSAWKDHPDIFVHHASELVDYAWRALHFENVYNGWVKNVEFKDFNEGLAIDNSFAVTVKNAKFSGKKGHMSAYARFSYGVLFDQFLDVASHHHGPGLRWGSANTVYTQSKYAESQSIDAHSLHPYSSLLDNTIGGVFNRSGNRYSNYPNHAQDLVFWNFYHDGVDVNPEPNPIYEADKNLNLFNHQYNFWNLEQQELNTYALPKFVGFRWDPNDKPISFKNEGLNELYGQKAYPESLYDAQLQLRLYGRYLSASSAQTHFPARHANDGNYQTAWRPKEQAKGSWLLVDLIEEKTISHFLFEQQGKGIKRFAIEYWAEGAWQRLKETDAQDGWNKIAFASVRTQWVRLLILDTSSEAVTVTMVKTNN